MQIGLECFMDEQISSMIASENRHGECEIQGKKECIVYDTNEDHYLEGYFVEIIYVFLTIFLYLLKCPQSLILSALRAFCFCGKPRISRSIFLYFRYQAWLKSW